ncbi:hypothetical protein AAVH_29685, partial [Aphelenchoides avenae]
MAAKDSSIEMDFDQELLDGVEEVSSAKATGSSSASVRIEPCLSATSNGRLSILVTNYSGTQQELKPGELIGHVEEVHDYCSAENALSSPVVTKWLEEACQESDARPAAACVRSISERNADLLEIIKAKMGNLRADERDAIDALVLEFQDIFALTESELTQTDLVMHHIETVDERPISTRVRQIPYALREKFAAMLKDYLSRGLISPSTSPYASPVVLVSKKEKGSIRMCVDYRLINDKTVKTNFPLINIDTTLMSLGKRKYFTSIDFLCGYFQIRTEPASKHKTAFSTPLGHYEFNVMPMGMSNSVATFQRFMNRLFDGILNDFAYSYVDDLLVASETFEDHLDHLRQVFERVRYANLKLKAQKCTIAAESIPFLGHILTREGIKMDADKLTPIRDYPLPKNVKEMLRFLGMASYYRKFVKNFATIAAPLYRLVHKDARFKFGDDELRAFETLKRALCGDLVLRFPDFVKAMNDPDKRFVVITDASK